MASRTKWFMLGTGASLAAGFIIEWLLAVAAIEGLEALFARPYSYALVALIAVGVAAYAGYSAWAVNAGTVMRRVSPLALVLAGAGVALYAAGFVGLREAGLFIVAAYLVELVVGYRLAGDFKSVDAAASHLFLVGVSVYVATLPLVLLDHRFALLPLAGNTVKIAGLAVLAARNTILQQADAYSSMKASRPLLADSPAAR